MSTSASSEKSRYWKIFSLNVRSLLALKGLKQRDLAAGVGETQSTVSKWLTGAGQPNPEQLLKIGAFLDVSVENLARTAPEDGEFCVVPKRLLLDLLGNARGASRKIEVALGQREPAPKGKRQARRRKKKKGKGPAR